MGPVVVPLSPVRFSGWKYIRFFQWNDTNQAMTISKEGEEERKKDANHLIRMIVWKWFMASEVLLSDHSNEAKDMGQGMEKEILLGSYPGTSSTKKWRLSLLCIAFYTSTQQYHCIIVFVFYWQRNNTDIVWMILHPLCSQFDWGRKSINLQTV